MACKSQRLSRWQDPYFRYYIPVELNRILEEDFRGVAMPRLVPPQFVVVVYFLLFFFFEVSALLMDKKKWVKDMNIIIRTCSYLNLM